MKRNGIVELHVVEPDEDLEEKIRRHKHKGLKQKIFVIVILGMIIGGTYLLWSVQSFTKTRVVSSYKSESSSNSKYITFAKGNLKLGRDGVLLLDGNGRELWNQPYQIKDPVISICENTLAIGDKGGNSILVFEKDGLKGEIRTTLPIEKISVSNQGIVAALLKNEEAPRIICYDAKGNVLVTHNKPVNEYGYPIGISISKDGEMLLVSYLQIESDKYDSKIIYYNFDEVGQSKADNEVAATTYENSIMPTTFFMNNSTSVIVGDHSFLIYEGSQIPKQKKEIKLEKEIKSVIHSDSLIGFILKNETKGYELRVYNKSGTQKMSKKFTGEYNNAEIIGNQIIMYEGKNCNIISMNGVNVFEGAFETEIQSITPVFGINKYIVANANGIETIRLIK